MNLHGLVAPAIGAVNPFVTGLYRASDGSTNDHGKRIPLYADGVAVSLQVQPLSNMDLKQIDAINVGGIKKAIYVYGEAFAVVRKYAKGGDLIDVTQGGDQGTYLVTVVPEAWSDGASGAAWGHVIAVLQND